MSWTRKSALPLLGKNMVSSSPARWRNTISRWTLPQPRRRDNGWEQIERGKRREERVRGLSCRYRYWWHVHGLRAAEGLRARAPQKSEHPARQVSRCHERAGKARAYGGPDAESLPRAV